jgi:L-alanine-DL-glutamate epimerase-like enolase superfamily enzyme
MTAKRAPLAKQLGGPYRDILSTQIDAVRDTLDPRRTARRRRWAERGYDPNTVDTLEQLAPALTALV